MMTLDRVFECHPGATRSNFPFRLCWIVCVLRRRRNKGELLLLLLLVQSSSFPFFFWCSGNSPLFVYSTLLSCIQFDRNRGGPDPPVYWGSRQWWALPPFLQSHNCAVTYKMPATRSPGWVGYSYNVYCSRVFGCHRPHKERMKKKRERKVNEERVEEWEQG